MFPMHTASRVCIVPLSFAEVFFNVCLQLSHLKQQMDMYRLEEIVKAAWKQAPL